MQVIDFEQLGLVIVESRLDFIAPKMCTIAMDSLLTAGGKEHRSRCPNERKSAAVNASEPATQGSTTPPKSCSQRRQHGQ